MSSSFATAVTATRRFKWQYPPLQPTPRILQLPRRPRRRATKNVLGGKHNSGEARKDHKGKLEALFDQERAFSRTGLPVVLLECGDGEKRERRRERVGEEEEEEEEGEGGGVVEEERWRFQAEMLRAECNLLRMEREIAERKMERTKVKMDRTLKSAVHTLVSGQKKICNGKVLEEEIQHLAEKLQRLQRNLRVKDSEVGKNSSYFDKQTYLLLQRRLQKLRTTSDEICMKEIQEMAEASLLIKSSSRVNENLVSGGKSNAEILRRKMEGLSKGMLLDRMKEEYGSMLSTANSSVASCAPSFQRIEAENLSSSLIQQFYKEKESCEEDVCSGHCKAIVRRIVEQVRVDTEQWSQMQEMLGQVREEMEELKASRDFWEDRALDSDYQIQSLHSAVQEWRQKAISSESKGRELQVQVSTLHGELDRLRKEESTRPTKANGSPLTPRNPHNEMEKRVLICHLKENQRTKEDGRKQREGLTDGRKKPDAYINRTPNAPKRMPFQNIRNSSFSARQNGKAVFPCHCPQPSKT